MTLNKAVGATKSIECDCFYLSLKNSLYTRNLINVYWSDQYSYCEKKVQITVTYL